MRRFEYKILTARSVNGEISLETLQEINQERTKGWELVNTNHAEPEPQARNGSKVLLVLKREIEGPK